MISSFVQVIRFHEADELTTIAFYLPTGDFRLAQGCYELVLEAFLRKDHEVNLVYHFKTVLIG